MEQERMAMEFEQTLITSKLEIQEETLAYMGKEIHDNIGQVLSLVKLNLNMLSSTADETKMKYMDELMEKAIFDLRSLSHLLDTDYLRNQGWVTAVEKLFLDLKRSEKYIIYTDIDEELPLLSDEKSVILFRMIQEIVNNIIKHAAASQISIEAIKKETQIGITIKDNGKGFDTATASAGTGLQNIKSRSKMIDATITFTSKKNNGTTVNIMLNT